MSTIHDALKKVQDDMGPQNNPEEKPNQPETPNMKNPFNAPPEPPEHPDVEEQASDNSNNNKIRLALLIPVLVIAFLAAGLTVFGGKVKNFKITLPSFQKSSTPKIRRSSVKPKLQYGMFFKGVMTVNERNVAMIDDAIYEAGDMVGQKKILAITKNTVTMVDETGNQIILKVFK